jgi:hypothetical protein
MKAEDLTAFLTWLPFAVTATALVGLGLWFFRPGVHRWALPPQRHRAVPWSWGQVAIVFILFLLLWDELLVLTFRFVPMLAWVYGPGVQEAFEATFRNQPGTPLSVEEVLAFTRAQLWVRVLFLPFQVGFIYLILWAWSQALPYQLGLTRQRLFRNVLVGIIGWFSFTLFLLLLNQALVSLLTHFGQAAAEEPHPLTKFGHGSSLLVDHVLLVASAVVAAPLIEELFFRGVLQSWLSAPGRPEPPSNAGAPPVLGVDAFFRKRWARQSAVIGLAIVLSLVARISKIDRAWTSGWPALLGELVPGLFFLGLAGTFLAWRNWRGWPREDAAGDPVGAVFASALFFAAAHSGVWPTPVALFPPIVMHSLFNGVSCVLLFFPHLAEPFTQPPKGNPETAALMRPVEVSTSTPVPGSQEPRRR